MLFSERFYRTLTPRQSDNRVFDELALSHQRHLAPWPLSLIFRLQQVVTTCLTPVTEVNHFHEITSSPKFLWFAATDHHLRLAAISWTCCEVPTIFPSMNTSLITASNIFRWPALRNWNPATCSASRPVRLFVCLWHRFSTETSAPRHGTWTPLRAPYMVGPGPVASTRPESLPRRHVRISLFISGMKHPPVVGPTLPSHPRPTASRSLPY